MSRTSAWLPFGSLIARNDPQYMRQYDLINALTRSGTGHESAELSIDQVKIALAIYFVHKERNELQDISEYQRHSTLDISKFKKAVTNVNKVLREFASPTRSLRSLPSPSTSRKRQLTSPASSSPSKRTKLASPAPAPSSKSKAISALMRGRQTGPDSLHQDEPHDQQESPTARRVKNMLAASTSKESEGSLPSPSKRFTRANTAASQSPLPVVGGQPSPSPLPQVSIEIVAPAPRSTPRKQRTKEPMTPQKTPAPSQLQTPEKQIIPSPTKSSGRRTKTKPMQDKEIEAALARQVEVDAAALPPEDESQPNKDSRYRECDFELPFLHALQPSDIQQQEWLADMKSKLAAYISIQA